MFYLGEVGRVPHLRVVDAITELIARFEQCADVLRHRVVAVRWHLLGELRGWFAEGREEVRWVLPRGTACELRCVRSWAVDRVLIIAISSVR